MVTGEEQPTGRQNTIQSHEFTQEFTAYEVEFIWPAATVGFSRQAVLTGGLAGSVVLLEEKIKCNWFGITLKRKR
jgi:hypothetical protein